MSKECLTLKYGLQADKMTLWALRNWPSALRVTSTSDSSSNRVSKTENNVDRWLFHFRQNCCSVAILVSFLCAAAALSVRRPHLKADLTWEADAWWLGCGRLMMASSGLIYFALRRYFSSGDRQPSVVLLGHICCSGRWWVGGSGKPRLTSTVRS